MRSSSRKAAAGKMPCDAGGRHTTAKICTIILRNRKKGRYMGGSVALAGASIFGLLGLLTVPRSSHAASPAGVLIEVRMRTIQHPPGDTARAASTLVGQDCESTIEDYARKMAKMVLRRSESDQCTNKYSEAAGTVTFSKTCRRPVPTSVYGEFRVGSSSFTGTIATGYLMGGRPVIIDAEYSGKRIGTCKYPQPTK